MKINSKISSKELYQKNIEHSSKKWISKVSIKDTEKYLSIIKSNLKNKNQNLSILSLGVRNGREIDMFRVCKNSKFLTQIIKILERKSFGFRTMLTSYFDSINRSDIDNIDENSVVGIDINPKSKRCDIGVQSFEMLDYNLKNKFDIVYTNSLDHTADPYKVSIEIKESLKDLGFVILAFPLGQGSGVIDPTSNINLEDVIKLFGNNIVYYKYAGSGWGYTEYIIKIER